jgi:uncharacterized membrane protein
MTATAMTAAAMEAAAAVEAAAAMAAAAVPAAAAVGRQGRAGRHRQGDDRAKYGLAERKSSKHGFASSCRPPLHGPGFR